MTDLFKTSKVISALPSVIEPNTTYWVRTGLGFDLYLSDSTGSTVHKINGTPPYIPVPYNFTVNGDATLNTSISQTSDVTAAITLANSGVTAGTYGSSTEVPAIIVDLKGRVTKVTKTPIRASSTTQTGIVQLSVATNSTSVSTAATSSALKATYDLALAAIPNSKFGTALGVATLDATGKIPSGQLPSYVDDVMEFATEFEFPNPGESGKLYIELSSNKIFRWTGTTYVNISGGSEIADASLKLYTARSFSLTGGATSNIVNFDGTGNVTLTINGLNPDTLTKAVPIVKGGTGAITAADARNNLGLGTAAIKNVGGVDGLLELSGSKVPSSNLPEASLTQAGIVMLDESYESDSVTTAPTSNAFKGLYDAFLFLLQGIEAFINSKSNADGLASLDDSGKLPTAQLTTHTHTPADIGLGNINNTSDIAKPISTATQNALNAKANTSHTHTPAQVGLSNAITLNQFGLNSTFKSGQASTGEANPNDIRTNGMVYCNDTMSAGWFSDGAIYSQFHSNIWGHEIYGDYRTGNISVRGLNSGTWSSWKQIATKDDINNLVNFTHVGPTEPSTSGLAVNSVWLDTSTEA